MLRDDKPPKRTTVESKYDVPTKAKWDHKTRTFLVTAEPWITKKDDGTSVMYIDAWHPERCRGTLCCVEESVGAKEEAQYDIKWSHPGSSFHIKQRSGSKKCEYLISRADLYPYNYRSSERGHSFKIECLARGHLLSNAYVYFIF